MARALILDNPLDASRRRYAYLPAGTELMPWAEHEAPAPGRAQRAVFVNDTRCEDSHYRVAEDDEVLVTFAPAYEQVVAYVVNAVIAFVVGFVLSKLFMPSRPKAGNTPQASQVYGIAPPKNAARLGQPIPVIYGSVIALPDFAAQPYVFYDGNEQFIHALLCLGLGEYDVAEMLFGQTKAAPLADGIVRYWVFPPAAHNSTFGVIDGTTRVRENVVSSPAVGDQELVAPNAGGALLITTWYWKAVAFSETQQYPPGSLDLRGAPTVEQKLALLPQNPAIGTSVLTTLYDTPTFRNMRYTATTYVATQTVPNGSLIPPPHYDQAGQVKWIGSFETCKPGAHGSVLELDFVFPGGLYMADGSGNLADATVTVTVEAQPIDNDGADAGALLTFTESFTAKDNTPQRRTIQHPVPSGRYRVRAQRTSNSDLKATTSDHVTWAGLKFQLDPPPAGTAVYGNVTLIAVQMKATNGVASDAASSMRFRVTRRLAPLGDPTAATAPTVNPADVFVDVLCAAYGGGRPVTQDEVDLITLGDARTAWADDPGFCAVFDQPSTVWEALALSVQTVHAAPLPVGSRMSVVFDGVQPVRSQLFTDANIVAGSLVVSCSFDTTGTPAGVRVTYRDPVTFSEAALVQPVDAPDYTTVDLFGCTSAVVAAQHATLLQAKRRLQRRTIKFDTELEGLSCLPGDRIGVAAGMVKWAQSARVAFWDGALTVNLDTALDWTGGTTHAVLLRDRTGVPARVVGVMRGANDAQLVLPGAAPFELVGLYDTLEATLVSFGVVDEEVTDWSLLKVTPNGSTVSLEAVNYDPDVYAGSAAFTRETIAVWNEPGELLEEGAP